MQQHPMNLQQWGLARWVRLALAVIFLIAGIVSNDGFAFVAAAGLGVQGIFNVGCCGAGPCQTDNTPRPASELNKAVTYEEIP